MGISDETGCIGRWRHTYVIVVVVVCHGGAQWSGTLSINMLIEVGNRDIIKTHKTGVNQGFRVQGFRRQSRHHHHHHHHRMNNIVIKVVIMRRKHYRGRGPRSNLAGWGLRWPLRMTWLMELRATHTTQR